jgi:hypothetical protein
MIPHLSDYMSICSYIKSVTIVCQNISGSTKKGDEPTPMSAVHRQYEEKTLNR